MIASPSTTRPSASTARQRSASPSWARPRSAPWDTTACCSASMCVDPQPSLMLSPSGSALIAMTLAPAARYARGAAADAAPCAQSTTTVSSSSRVVSGLADVAQIPVERVVGVDDAADARTDRPLARPGGDEFFDPVLGGVVELVPARAEDLDAVVGHRVVRRRDHHAEVGVVGVGQVGDRRASAAPRPAARRHPRWSVRRSTAASSISPLARGSRPTTATRRRAGEDLTEPTRRRRTQRNRQLSGQIAIGDAAHPVGAEQSTHRTNFSYMTPEDTTADVSRRAAARIGTRPRPVAPFTASGRVCTRHAANPTGETGAHRYLSYGVGLTCPPVLLEVV